MLKSGPTSKLDQVPEGFALSSFEYLENITALMGSLLHFTLFVMFFPLYLLRFSCAAISTLQTGQWRGFQALG